MKIEKQDILRKADRGALRSWTILITVVSYTEQRAAVALNLIDLKDA